MLAIVLLAFALRAWRIDFQSLWSDEAISVNRANLPVAAMLEQMPVEHVPGYFVALRSWIWLTGEADYGLRAFSLLPAVLAVALIYRLGAETASPTRARFALGAAAALLAAVNPFFIWYAQEVRMYAWLLAASLASTLALWRILTAQKRSARWWAAALYALSTAACVYLHFFGALVPIAQTLYVAGFVLAGLVAGRRGREVWNGPLAWAAGSAGALLLFAPWLPRVGEIFGFSGWREAGTVSELPWHYLQSYLGAPLLPEFVAVGLPWVVLALAALGAIWWLRMHAAGALLQLTMLAIPALGVLALAVRNPDYHERYTIFLAAPLLLLAAAGLVALVPAAWERAGAASERTSLARTRPLASLPAAALLLALVVASLAATWRQATDITFHKPDYRSAVARIVAGEKPGDVILVDGPDPSLVFAHYYSGSNPVAELRDLEGADWSTIDARMIDATAGATRAWELLYFHEPAGVQMWMATKAWPSEPTGHNNIRITLYGLDGPQTPAVEQALLVSGESAALRLDRSQVGPATVAPGDLLQVTTEWFTLAPLPELKFSLRMVAGETAAGEETLVAAQDYVPQNWFAPTPIWIVDQPARDTRAFEIPADLAPGAYSITLRVYDAATGLPLHTTVGDDIPLGAFEVAAP
jgi:4-amino-4-deoxy-L-arabinose transferase-like glycosyltransferase